MPLKLTDMKRLAVSFLATILIGTAAVYSQSVGPVCPDVVVKGPAAPVNFGETVMFYADVSGNRTGLKYRWSVDKGNILTGQGKPVINVGGTDALAGQTILAKVEIEGLLSECKSVFWDTAEIISGGSPIGDSECICFDQVGEESGYELTGKINNFLYELTKNPGKIGFILTYGPERETEKRHQLISAYLYLIRLGRNDWLRRISEANVVLVEAGDSDSLRSNFVIAENASDYSKCGCDEEQPKCPKIRVIGPQLVAQPGAAIRFRLENDGRHSHLQ